MSMMLGRWGFSHCTDINDGTGAAAGRGFTIGTSGAKGSTTSLFTALTHNVYNVGIGFSMGFASGPTMRNIMVDIMYDPAGGTSWSVLIPDLQAAYLYGGGGGDGNQSARYSFPVFIPSGSTVGVRGAQENSGISSGGVVMWLWGGPSAPDAWWYGHKVEAMGANHSATCRGVVVTPGASNAFGTAVRVDNTTGTMRPFGSLQLGAPGFSAATGQCDAKGYLTRIKRSSTVVWEGLPYVFRGFDTDESGSTDGNFGPNWVDGKETDEIWVDALCNTTSPQDLNVVVYGVW